MAKHEAIFNKDLDNKKIIVTKKFDAPIAKVWEAWTKSEILDQWWAPKPYHVETKSMDFKEGGKWFYFMVGPNGERFGNVVEYKIIVPQQSIASIDMFCDEAGNEDTSMPRTNWKVSFSQTGETTTVVSELTYDKKEDVQKILDTGFESGYAMGLNNLEEYMAK